MVKLASENDYMSALTGGPWTIFGHYLIIKPWTPSFNPMTDTISTSPVWVRIANLPMVLYEEGVILRLAAGIGRPIKVDQTTMHVDKGRFARICVEMDLTKPLKGSVTVNNSRYLVEYEGLGTICFHCGRYGHFQHQCVLNPKNTAAMEQGKEKDAQPEAAKYGSSPAPETSEG